MFKFNNHSLKIIIFGLPAPYYKNLASGRWAFFQSGYIFSDQSRCVRKHLRSHLIRGFFYDMLVWIKLVEWHPDINVHTILKIQSAKYSHFVLVADVCHRLDLWHLTSSSSNEVTFLKPQLSHLNQISWWFIFQHAMNSFQCKCLYFNSNHKLFLYLTKLVWYPNCLCFGR